MSDNYGFDFNNDGKVSFTESHMTYHIERETARNNSIGSSFDRSSPVTESVRISHKTKTEDSGNDLNIPDVPGKDEGSSSVKKKPNIAMIVFLIVSIYLIVACSLDYIFNHYFDSTKIISQSIQNMNQSDYQYAIQLIQDGEYREAANKLNYLKKSNFSDAAALKDYAWALYYYEMKDYVLAYNNLVECADVVRQHSEFDNPDELLETIKPLAEKQSADTKRYIEASNKKAAEQWNKSHTNTEKNKKSSSYDSSYESSDEFDVSDYYSAEDFYDDHYDDFFDYYDAEEYYEEHGGF